MSALRVERWLWAAAVALVLLHPVAYVGMYAGDSEIHLVYGRAAAAGRFFEFNPGEKTPGVTSPGYMLMLAPLFKVLPESVVPLVVKILDVFAWYGSIALVFVLLRRLTGDRRLAGGAALIAGLLPGSAYNATIGMENGLFAFVVLLAVVCAIRVRWFEDEPAAPLGGDVVVGVLLGCGCWLRPEGFVVAALFHLVRGWRGRRSMDSAVPLVLLAGALLLFHYQQTGHWLPASGRARILSGHLDAWQLGPLSVSPKPIRLLALYLPLSAFWLLGCWWVIKDRLPSPHPRVLMLAAAISLLFFALYSTVLGAAHLGRYLIFVMPFMVVLAVLAAGELWQQRRAFRAPLFVLAGLWMAGMWSIEIVKRRQLGAATEILHAMHAPAERARFSDRMDALLGHPAKRPIVLGLQEVQIRYWLDERFLVRSLDGRTDPELLNHVDRGGIDHVGYLRERRVDFVLETPNYNRDPSRWSLARLEKLQIGETARSGGVSFVRLASDPTLVQWVFRVTRDE